jgi:hypothetical protein
MGVNIFADRSWISKPDNAEALQRELHKLAAADAAASLPRRFELHLTLAWQLTKQGGRLDQQHVEQALAIARRLGERRREGRGRVCLCLPAPRARKPIPAAIQLLVVQLLAILALALALAHQEP